MIQLEQLQNTIEFRDNKIKLLEICKDTYNIMVSKLRSEYGEDTDINMIENCFNEVINGISLENEDLKEEIRQMAELKNRIKERIEI